MKAIYIWGAGHYGALAALDMENKGKTIAGFIDSNKELQGKKRLGYEVFAPENILKNNNEQIFVIVATYFTVNDIAKELKKNGYVYGKNFEIFEAVKENYLDNVFDNNTIENKNGKFHINDFKLVLNPSILFENEVILYVCGVGFYEMQIYYRLKDAGISVSYFSCSDSNKWGQCVNGIEIISPSRLKELDKEENLTLIITGIEADIMDKTVNGIVNKIIDEVTNLRLKTDKIYTSYAVNNFLIMNNFANRLKSPNCVHVYQSGKVGSRTVYESMLETGINCSHIHTFHKCRNLIPNTNQIKIITLVREPIARCLSEFFHHLSSNVWAEISFENICIRHLRWSTSWQFDWFDSELKAFFGVDIYANPFDREKGYSIIKHGNVEVLAMKLEKLSSLESVIGEFIGAPQFKLINENEADNKIYKYFYKDVKNTIKIPQDIFDIHYKNPKMDHFYSEEEKAAFLKKWEKNIAD